MSSQISTLGFANDATKLSGYMYRFERLGNFDLLIENTGANSVYFIVKEQTSPSGAFVPVSTPITIVPKGTKTLSLNLLSKKVGFFGSGNTTVNVQVNFRNPAALSGQGFDFVVTGKKGWGYDPGLADGEKLPNWGNPDQLL